MDQNDPREPKRFLAEMEEYLGRNELQAVLRLARERLEKSPGDLEARISLCRVWLLQGNFDEAREMLSDTERIIESLSQVYAAIGEVCLKRGMQEAALAYREKSQALQPGAPPDRSIAGWFGESEAPPRETDEEGAEEGDAAVPPDFQTVTLAELYIRQGHFQMAAEVLEKVVGADPQNAKAAALLQEALERGGRTISASPEAGMIAELSHWLDNIDRLRSHAT